MSEMKGEGLEGLFCLLGFRDKIILDYENKPLYYNTGSIFNYIERLVGAVGWRMASSGISECFTFTFKMPPDLWEAISAIQACLTPLADNDTVPTEEILAKWSQILNTQTLIVDGEEYPVILNDQETLTFEPQEDGAPSWLHAEIRGIQINLYDGLAAVRWCDATPVIMPPLEAEEET